jgi:hypothetical protein
MKKLKRLQKRLQAIHPKTRYEDLEHGKHTVEAIEHAALRGEIRYKRNLSTHR